ncbi:sugar phosphate isomerase/epimerase family protein [Sinorhizobium meliloti]|uniref:sugar phosphate isomerase/epimerase family protein n=1 Tax=Rhizobium meliloti TaxID=382 RepID=UPI000FD80D2D|nr:TIM barrel protein [Sinorhizobium meliloti]RVO98958.1 sugar phosphate isomerase/epimerase [Sinorhizobium meliloti]RVQ07718.1 sugar phosphate isomerase/epimerase [Sinorhizobium meliloti]
MNAFEPALCTVTFRKLPADEIVALAAKARLAAIEWAGDAHVPPGDTSTARTVGHLCESAGLKTSYGSYVAPPTDDLSALAPALATAVALGASNIRIWPGTRQRASRGYSADERRDAADAIRDMGAEAARHGITVSLEYHPQTLTDETSSALRLIEAVAHPNVYLYWQPRPGLPLVGALTEIASIGAHVSHVHVFAWDHERKRFPLASAEGYWQTALAAMPQSRWTGRRFAMLEFVAGDDPAAFLADAATLRKILKAEFPPSASAIADGN